MSQAEQTAMRASARMRAGLCKLRQLLRVPLAAIRSGCKKIVSVDQGKYLVGTRNAATRDTWVAEVLASLPAGARLLDAGAGECQYKKHCGHLKYVAQDVAIYDGKGEVGLQTGSWDFSQIDIVSDITAIPESGDSFDAILCTEVLEHLPDPIRALDEMARLLRPGGTFIITAPFWSLTHFAPYHYATGFNRYFYEIHLGRLGFDIVEMTPNGNFFECVGQELRRVPEMARLRMLERMSIRDTGSPEMLHFDYQVRAVKRPKL
jgi:SAM-dependent methyltransferase